MASSPADEKYPYEADLDRQLAQSDVPQRTPWYGYLWDSFGKPPPERRLMMKLDATLLLLSIFGLLARYIDQTNMSTAYVSGMKEEMAARTGEKSGLQLNYANTAWTLGYIIGQVPSTIAMNRVSPHYVIFTLEMTWTFLTLCTFWVKNWTHVYVIRFFVGLFESGYYPSLLFLIGSHYTKDELAKRSNLFQAATAAGTLISGVLQSGVYHTLNGKRGIAGWRWIFVVDFAISFPIAIGAFFLLPDLPNKMKPNWIFSAADINLQLARMKTAGREGPKKGSFNLKFVRNLFGQWHIWMFTACYSLYIFSQNPQQSMAFWFKYSTDPKYTVEQINYYPTGIYATQIVSALGFAWLSDTVLKGRRWPPLVAVAIWHSIDTAVLAGLPVYQNNRVVRWVFYYLSGVVNCTPGLLYAWCSEIIGGSSEKRGVVMGTFNSVAFSFNAWLPLLLFKQTEQPRVLKGTIAASVASALQAGFILGILYFSQRDIRRGIDAKSEEEELEDSPRTSAVDKVSL